MTDPTKIYLSIPYSGKEWLSFHLATRATADLMKAGNVVYSPITHSHPIATMEDMPHDDHDFWMRQDLPMLDCCNIMAVVKLDDWYNSKGVKRELMGAADIGIPVIYLTVDMFATDKEIDEWRGIDGTAKG